MKEVCRKTKGYSRQRLLNENGKTPMHILITLMSLPPIAGRALPLTPRSNYTWTGYGTISVVALLPGLSTVCSCTLTWSTADWSKQKTIAMWCQPSITILGSCVAGYCGSQLDQLFGLPYWEGCAFLIILMVVLLCLDRNVLERLWKMRPWSSWFSLYMFCASSVAFHPWLRHLLPALEPQSLRIAPMERSSNPALPMTWCKWKLFRHWPVWPENLNPQKNS